MKNKEILREQEPKTHLVIPVKVLGDQDSISMDELQVRLPEEPGFFGEDKARCVIVMTILLCSRRLQRFKRKDETGIHPNTLLDLREKAAQKKSGQGRDFPFRISAFHGI
jgi:hypothetical protein